MVDFLFEVFHIRIISALIMLLTASALDLWKREIHDILWISFGVWAIILVFLQPEIGDSLLQLGFSMIVAPFVLVAWRFGLLGGADALCIVTLSALAPQITLSNGIVTPFTTLTNTIFLSLITLLVNFSRNLGAILNHTDIFAGIDDTSLRKCLALFLGYRANQPKHGFSMERIEKGQRKLDFSLHHAENAEFSNTPNTWVTPGIPFVIYIAAGFIVQLLIGDLLIGVVSQLGVDFG